MRALMLAALACLIAAPVEGAEIYEANKVLVENYFTRDMPIYVEFIDEMSDGCLPRPNAIQTAMELGVQRAGLKLGEQQSSFWYLWAVASGHELEFQSGGATGTCNYVILVKFIRLSMFRDVMDKGTDMFLQVDALVVGTGASLAHKGNTQDTIRSWVGEAVDEIANEILKATAK